MHIVFVHFFYPGKLNRADFCENIDIPDIKTSIIYRNEKQFTDNNFHYVKDEFENKLKWWQNPEVLNKYIKGLNPDLVYFYGLNLPLQFRWLRHFVQPTTIIIGQHCGESPWIQKNLWLQQSALRVADAFVFTKKEDANQWLKCAAILESQAIFESEYFRKNPLEIYKYLKTERKNKQLN